MESGLEISFLSLPFDWNGMELLGFGKVLVDPAGKEVRVTRRLNGGKYEARDGMEKVIIPADLSYPSGGFYKLKE